MKLLITETQLEVLVSHIQEHTKPKKVINESWKEVVLGTAMLMGIKLSGANEEIANNALSNTETIKKISNTLEGPKIEKLADTLEKGGLSDAMSKILGNSHTLKANLDLAGEKLGVKTNVKIYNNSPNKQ